MHLYGSSNGGSDVDSYEIQWDQGPSVLTFVSLQQNMDSQVTVSSNISAGKPYRFKYRARNRQGWSEYSDVSYILAANVPAQILPVSVD